MSSMIKRSFAEMLGTFALVFFGTGAIIVNAGFDGALTHPGIAITFGFVVLAVIYTLGGVSGAHINPAVTLSFALSGRLEKKFVLPYLVSQLAGAFLASVILRYLFPESQTLGETIPSGSAMQSFILEFILSFFLMLVIFSVATGSKELGMFAGLAIGSTILIEAMVGGPVSGASMNPARSIAPAAISGNMQDLWVYLVAPITGAALAIPAFRMLSASSKLEIDK